MFLISVILAPIIFFVYWKNNLVCAPRAVFSSFLFGVIPLIFLAIGESKKSEIFYFISGGVLIFEMIVTPIIMLKRLGWEKFANDRLLAFFTFESSEIFQFIIVMILLRHFWKTVSN